ELDVDRVVLGRRPIDAAEQVIAAGAAHGERDRERALAIRRRGVGAVETAPDREIRAVRSGLVAHELPVRTAAAAFGFEKDRLDVLGVDIEVRETRFAAAPPLIPALSIDAVERVDA